MKKLIYTLALTALGLIYSAGIEVRQAPPQPDCSLDPELCNKK